MGFTKQALVGASIRRRAQATFRLSIVAVMSPASFSRDDDEGHSPDQDGLQPEIAKLLDQVSDERDLIVGHACHQP